MIVIGYKYITEQDAIDARKLCADYYGLPTSPDNVTIYYVDYQVSIFDVPVFWYIEYYPGTELVLGDPYEIEILIFED